MRFMTAAAFVAVIGAVPALADPGAGVAPKMKKVCHAENNGNPLFPAMKCHSVPVETAATTQPAAAAPAAEPAASSGVTQVALQNGVRPQ